MIKVLIVSTIFVSFSAVAGEKGGNHLNYELYKDFIDNIHMGCENIDSRPEHEAQILCSSTEEILPLSSNRHGEIKQILRACCQSKQYVPFF